MRKKVKFILLAVLAVCLIGLVIYHLPIHVEKTVNMTNSDGQIVELKADVAFHRSLIRPTVLKGTIVFDGKKYCDWDTFVDRFGPQYRSSNTWWDAFVDKWSGRDMSPADFAYENAKDIFEGADHRIDLIDISPGYSLDEFRVLYSDGVDRNGQNGDAILYLIATE